MNIRSLIIATFVILFSFTRYVSAATPIESIYPPPVPVDNPSFYLELVKNSAEFSEYSDFSITKYDFGRDYNGNSGTGTIKGKIILSLSKISSYDVDYTFLLYVTIDDSDKVSLSSKLNIEEIKNLISTFESKREISTFILKFLDNKPRASFVNDIISLTVGDYVIDYDPVKDDFITYNLPISMASEFPLLNIYKEKAEKAGCSIVDDNAIVVLKEEALNKIYIFSKVEGNCQNGDSYKDIYTDEGDFIINIPLKTDTISIVEPFWKKWSWLIGFILFTGLIFLIKKRRQTIRDVLKPSVEKSDRRSDTLR